MCLWSGTVPVLSAHAVPEAGCRPEVNSSVVGLVPARLLPLLCWPRMWPFGLHLYQIALKHSHSHSHLRTRLRHCGPPPGRREAPPPWTM